MTFSKCVPRTLKGLCLGVVGKYFEDIMLELGGIAVNLPPDVKVICCSLNFFILM